MDEEHAAARAGSSEEFPSGPTLTPVRRRGESHLLALILAAGVIFVATAIAKPWGGGLPRPEASATTAPLVAEIGTPSSESAPPPGASATTGYVVIEITTFSTESAPLPGASGALEFTPAETDQPAFVVVQQGEGDGAYSVWCAPDPGISPSVVGSGESVMSSRIVALECSSANLRRLESVLPSPSAP